LGSGGSAETDHRNLEQARKGRLRDEVGKPRRAGASQEETPARPVGKASKRPARKGRSAREQGESPPPRGARKLAPARPVFRVARLAGPVQRLPHTGRAESPRGRTSGGQGCGTRFGARGTALREEQGSEVARRALAAGNGWWVTVGQATREHRPRERRGLPGEEQGPEGGTPGALPGRNRPGRDGGVQAVESVRNAEDGRWRVWHRPR